MTFLYMQFTTIDTVLNEQYQMQDSWLQNSMKPIAKRRLHTLPDSNTMMQVTQIYRGKRELAL